VRIVGELYALSELTVRGEDHQIGTVVQVEGDGTYYRRDEGTVVLSLELAVDGVTGVAVSSGEVAPGAVWPAIDVSAGEEAEAAGEEPRDPLHVYRLRLVAAPEETAVLYDLVEGVHDSEGFHGSYFVDECTICGRPTIPVPMRGRFLLVPETSGAPTLEQRYRVAGFEATSTAAATLDYRLVGRGSYTIGGEVALAHAITLEVSVNEETTATLASGATPVPPEAPFPRIEIGASGPDPASDIRVFSLILVAHPRGAPASRWRRGDANDDGRVDLSDAIDELDWLFAGGSTLPCLDAADADGSRTVDLSDAVFLLAYIFLGATPPPAPGPDECGAAQEAVVLGCERFASCAE
jgi:hypothetical protein